MKETAAPRYIDWEAIELDYRAGVKSLRVIASDRGVSHGAINKRAKRDGWSRDLAAKIQSKADDLVSKHLVSSVGSGIQLVTEKEIIAANAQAIAEIQIGQRKDIGRARKLAMALLAELEAQTDNPELFAKLGEMLNSPDDKGVDKLNELYHKVISLPGRVDAMKKLAESLRLLISLERQAFKLDEDAPDTSRLPENLASMSTKELREFAVKNSRKLFGAAFVLVEESGC